MARPLKARVDPDVDLAAHGSARLELWQEVALSLRTAILEGSIAAGASLVEADLASRFGVSRGPVRDAFRELAREGLVVDLPRRGTIVSTLSYSDIQEVYEVREALEIKAAGMATSRASGGEIEALARSLEDLESAWRRRADYGESLAADLAFHRALVALSGNGRIIASYDQMLVQTQLNAVTAATVNPRLRRAMKRSAHEDIVRALRSRDSAAVSKAVVDHYTYARERLFAGYPRPSDIAPSRDATAKGG